MSRRTRVAIVGAGPQGLTAAVYLVHAGVDPADLVVLDPHGEWLAGWNRAFTHLKIGHLRSASVHHPHPHPYKLLQFARAHLRTSELVERYGLPTSGLFGDFCAHLIETTGLADTVELDTVVDVDPAGRLATRSGASLCADHVVWATDPALPNALGNWSSPDGSSVSRWDDVQFDRWARTVAVIGGGLTAAHLVERALDADAHVEWLTRRPVVVRDFDTDAGWLGPKEMSGFLAQREPQARLDCVLAARGGGTVPPWMMARIVHAEQAGRVCRRAGEVVVDSRAGGVDISIGGVDVTAEQVWWATGSAPSVAASDPLARLCSELGTQVVGGRPVLDTSLRIPGSVVHVMGRLAQLQLGPTAGNLAGARRGAELVVGTVAGLDAMYELLDA